MANLLPPLDLLDSLLAYDPDTGVITNKVSRGAAKAGKEAGTKGTYRQITIAGVRYLAHRIAYAMYHREDPGDTDIDHADRNKHNNRISNLRLSTRVDNLQNCDRTENAAHYYAIYGKRGVRYRARFTHNRRVYWCGTHATPELARQACLERKAQLLG